MKGKKFPYVFDCVFGKGDKDSPSSTKICEGLATADAKCAAAIPAVEPIREWPREFACHTDSVFPDGRKLVHKANLAW